MSDVLGQDGWFWASLTQDSVILMENGSFLANNGGGFRSEMAILVLISNVLFYQIEKRVFEVQIHLKNGKFSVEIRVVRLKSGVYRG